MVLQVDSSVCWARVRLFVDKHLEYGESIKLAGKPKKLGAWDPRVAPGERVYHALSGSGHSGVACSSNLLPSLPYQSADPHVLHDIAVMRWTDEDMWSVEVDLPCGSHEFKCITSSGEWEDGPNHTLQVKTSSLDRQTTIGHLATSPTPALT